jgi:hypothetical protein
VAGISAQLGILSRLCGEVCQGEAAAPQPRSKTLDSSIKIHLISRDCWFRSTIATAIEKASKPRRFAIGIWLKWLMRLFAKKAHFQRGKNAIL